MFHEPHDTSLRNVSPAGSPPSPRQPRFVQIHHEDRNAVRDELLDGLAAPAARIAPKYLYDELGSCLFQTITELPEYYPTRTEAAIFEAHAQDMAARLPAGATLVDLGAGNCRKAARLFGALRPARYVAVDISVDFLSACLHNLQQQHPTMDMVGVGMDFSQSLALPPEAGQPGDGPRVLFYPGSSIGNFNPAEARSFLRQAHGACAGGGLLIGVDLIKDSAVLEPAYDDALGVTAAFNRNLLRHVNRLAGTDFDIAHWRHVAFFNAQASRIEMHLEAVGPVTVRWPGHERRFASRERIHTENSYKWKVDDFAALLGEAGFSSPTVWTDEQAWFAVLWAPA